VCETGGGKGFQFCIYPGLSTGDPVGAAGRASSVAERSQGASTITPIVTVLLLTFAMSWKKLGRGKPQ